MSLLRYTLPLLLVLPLVPGCGDNDQAKGAQAPGEVVAEGDYVVTTQEDLAQLKGVTRVNGNVTLQGEAITSLAPLESLSIVEGDLRIVKTMVIDLKGLDRLSHVEEFLWIESNGSLENLAGLVSLTSTGWSTVVTRNYVLKTLSGLDNLRSVDGQLSLTDNIALENIDALGKLTVLGESLNVYNNSAISQCAVTSLRERLIANGWAPKGTIHGLRACAGQCNGSTCES